MAILSMISKRFGSMSSFFWKKDGSTADRAADSALAIKALTGTTADGFYWIKNRSGVAVQVYCIMQNIEGGGWMLLDSTNSTFSHFVGSSSWSGSTRIVNFTQNDGGCAGVNQYNMTNTLNFTDYRIQVQRVSSIGQCSGWTNQTDQGYYDHAVPYNGTYTSSGMCTWGDNVYAYGCCNASLGAPLKNYWIVKGANVAGNYTVTYRLACTAESGTNYQTWWVR